jgi:hypothetical protein
MQSGGQVLTYASVAQRMGRTPPEQHARAVAQMCDLLDAAAALAGVPLLALVAVREAGGGINQKAWKKEYGTWREPIIQRSLAHKFSVSDFQAIGAAINDLGERGNILAWRYVQGLYPGDLLYRRLTGSYSDEVDQANAIDDLGSDSPDRAKSLVWTYARDPQVRFTTFPRHLRKAQMKGSRKDTGN